MSYFNELVNKTIGNVFVIAEACDNHMGSLEMAKALARGAKQAGCDAVKFQHHLPSEEMLRDAEMTENFDQHLLDFLTQNALSINDHNKLKNFCDEIGIMYLCTPFSFLAAMEISNLVPFFKIGSGEFQDLWFIDNLKKLNKPLLLSTGMCSWEEIIDSKKYIKDFDYSLMNCLSEYPVNLQDLNLGVVKEMVKEFPEIIIGHSDHSQTNFTSVIAVTYGAKIIEKHITLNKNLKGPDHKASMEPKEFKKMVESIREIEIAMGNSNKEPTKSERKNLLVARKSIVAMRDISKGEPYTSQNITTKRPGTGISPMKFNSFLGKKAKRNFKKDELIST